MRPTPKLDAAREEVKRLWNLACQHDNIPTSSKFVVMSANNPFKADFDKAMSEFMRLRRARYTRAARAAALDSIGVKRVIGAQGGVYYE